MLSKEFWFGEGGALVRAIRTAAQTAIAMLGVSQFSLFSVDWENVLGVSGASAFLSVLMSLDRNNASSSSAPTVQSVVPEPNQKPTLAVTEDDSNASPYNVALQPQYPAW